MLIFNEIRTSLNLKNRGTAQILIDSLAIKLYRQNTMTINKSNDQ